MKSSRSIAPSKPTSAWSAARPGSARRGTSWALPHLLYRWEQQPNQNGDDGDNDQGFNSGETVYGTLSFIRDVFHVFLQYCRFAFIAISKPTRGFFRGSAQSLDSMGAG